MPEPKVIGKISNTLEEIRDILVGKKESKLNNSLQAIAKTNVSVTSLMKELVDTTKKQHKLSILEAVRDNKNSGKGLSKKTDKVIHKIYDILHEISESVNKIYKKGNFDLKSNSDSKALKSLMKDAKKDKRAERIMNMIKIVTNLRKLSFKDLFLAKKKVKQVEKIFDKLKLVHDKLGSQKDVKKLISFAKDAIDIVKRLNKIALMSKMAVMGAKAIDKVFFGKWGLIKTLNKMKRHERSIKKAKKMMRNLMVLSGQMLLVALFMTGVASLGVGAMAGAVMAAGMMVVFGLTFSVIGMFEKPIRKGILIMAPLMISVILAGVGLMLINKGTKGLEWDQLGKAGAAIVGFGLIAALLGIPPVAAVVGTGTLLLVGLGVALVALGGGIALFNLLVTNKAIKKVSKGIPKILKAITSIFGTDDKKSSGVTNFGNGVLGFVMGCLRLGGAWFAAATLIVVSVSLGIAGLVLRSWNNFDTKAIDKIEYAIGKLDKVFGLGFKEKTTASSLALDVVNTLTSPFQAVSALLKFGKNFLRLGTLLLASLVMGMIKGSIDKWSNFNPKSLDNVKTAFEKLDDLFDLGLMKPNNAKGYALDIARAGIDTLTWQIQTISTLLRCGKVFVKMATLMLAVMITDYVVEKIKGWDNFKSEPIDKVTAGITKLSDFFNLGLGKKKENLVSIAVDSVMDAARMTGDFIGLGASLLRMGVVFVKMGTLAIAVGIMDYVVDKVKEWETFDGTPIDNVLTGVGKLSDFLGLGLGENRKGIVGAVNGLVIDVVSLVGNFFGLGAALLRMGSVFTKLAVLSYSIGVVDEFVKVVAKWKGFNGEPIDKVLKHIQSFGDFFGIEFGKKNIVEKGISLFGDIINVAGVGALELGSTLLSAGSQFVKLGVLSTAVGVVEKMIDAMIKAGKNSSLMKDSLNGVFEAIDLMIEYFFHDDKLDTSMWDNIKSVGMTAIGGLLAGPIGAIGGMLLSSDDRKTKLSVLTMAVGIVDKMADVIIKMGEKKPQDAKIALDNTFKALEMMTDYLFGKSDGTGSNALERVGKAMEAAHGDSDGLWECLVGDGSDVLDTRIGVLAGCIGVVGEMADIITSMDEIKDMGATLQNLFNAIDKTLVYISGKNEDELSDIDDIASELPGIFESLKEVIEQLDGNYDKPLDNLNKLIGGFSKFNNVTATSMSLTSNSLAAITESLSKYSISANGERIKQLNTVMYRFHKFAELNNPLMFQPITKVIDKINTVEIEKAQALTDTFKSFSNISTIGSFFFNFKQQVALFTDACVRLVDAINGNTDALTTENIMNEADNVTPEPSKKSVAIANTQELAAMIAEAINEHRFGGGMSDAIPVELRINGNGGDSWVITRW